MFRVIVALWPVYLECFKLSPLSNEVREMPTDEVLQAHIAPYLEHALNNLYQVGTEMNSYYNSTVSLNVLLLPTILS